MITAVIGPQNSGKSKIAEDIACSLSENRIYLATMQVMDEEGVRRIERHRAMREGKDFVTIECPYGLAEACQDALINCRDSDEAVVLLECVANLTGNIMFEAEREKSISETVLAVCEEIVKLGKCASKLVIVSSEYEMNGIEDAGSIKYLEALRLANEELIKMADEVIRPD